MNHKVLNLLQRIDQQIKFEKTGTRKIFAQRMGISIRQLSNYLAYMRDDLQLQIEYCKIKQSYYYKTSKTVIIKFGKNI